MASASADAAAASSRRSRVRSTGWRVWMRRLAFATILLGVGAVGVVFVILNSVVIPKPTRAVKTTSFVCTAEVTNGECSAANSVGQFSAGGSKRIIVSLEEMSDHLINAVVAGEDRSFFEHSGVDPWGIARAAYRGVAGSASQQGGSTITQQLVKQVYLTSDRTAERKIKEAAIALKLERQLSKQEILRRYLNEIPLGRGAIGVEAGARAYFDKAASDLDLAESAYLAGLIRAPSYADEPTNAEKPEEGVEATRRRHTVLVAMEEEGYITAAERAAADEVPWEGHVLDRPPPSNGTDLKGTFASVGGWYVIDWVRSQLLAMPNIGESALYGEGLKVYLTVDLRQQLAAQAAVAQVLTAPEDPAAALVAVDDGGRIQALIGGRDHAQSQVNLALGKEGGGSGRAPGSTFKPIALAAYVDAGNSVSSKFWGPPIITFPKANDGEDWDVHNYEDRDWGETTLEYATWHSVNTAYAQVMQQITAEKFAAMALRLGIRSEVRQVPSAVLGTSEVSVLDMATAYSTFANHGTLKRPYIVRRVEAADGTVLYDVADDPAYAPQETIRPEVADTVTSVLAGVLRDGSGRSARIRHQAAAKTGTTDDYKDAWFVGYTCRLTAAVWMGYPGVPGEPVPVMENVRGVKVSGGTYPAQIWKKYMDVATDGTRGCTIEKVDAGTVVNPPDPQYAPTTLPPAPLPGEQPVTLPDGTVVPPGGSAPTTTAAPPPAG